MRLFWRKLTFQQPVAIKQSQLLGLGIIKGKGVYPCPSDLGPHLVQAHVGPMHVATVSVSSYVSQPSCFLEGLGSLASSILSGSQTLPAFLQSSLSPGGKDLMEDIHFRTECSKISHSAYCLPMNLFAFVPICSRRKLKLSKALGYEQSRCHQESFY